MARLTAEERVQREVDAVAKRARAAVKTPAQWTGFKVAELAGWGALAIGAFCAWTAYSHDSVHGLVVSVLVAVWALTAARWVAVPSSERSGHHAAAAVAVAVMLWIVDQQPYSLGFAALVAAASMFWVAWTARARKRLHRFAWAAAQLADATGDDRELHEVLTPASTDSGLPARWYVPAKSARQMVTIEDDDPAGDDLDMGLRQSRAFDPARVLSQALGLKVAVRVAHGVGLVTAAIVRSAAVERAIGIVRERLGKVEVEVFEDADGTITAIEAKGFKPRLANSQMARASHERLIGSTHPGRWRASWDLEADQVRFEQRPKMASFVPHEAEPLTDQNRYVIPYAVDEDGEVIFWTLDGVDPHMMTVGPTGTGKTVLINGIVLEVTRRDFRVRICDPKRIEFVGLRDWPNVEVVATSVEDMLATIWLTHEEMMDRYDRIERGDADTDDFEPIVLVLDEFRNFHRQVTSWYGANKQRGMPSKCPVFDWVASIAEMGRTAHIHLVLGTQRPDADFMTGSMRDNFRARASLGRLSPQGAEMMWESRALGTTVPRGLRGRGTGMTPEGRVVEMQTYWTPDPRKAARSGSAEDQRLLAALRPTTTTYAARVIELGEESDLDGNVHSLWERVLEAQLVIALGRPEPVEPAPAPDAGRTPPPWDVKDAGEASADYAEEYPFDPFEGYDEASETSVGNVAIGDLVLVDPDTDHWAVVDDLEPDPSGDELTCISWRDDDGEDGVLSLEDDEPITVRRVLDDALVDA